MVDTIIRKKRILVSDILEKFGISESEFGILTSVGFNPLASCPSNGDKELVLSFEKEDDF